MNDTMPQASSGGPALALDLLRKDHHQIDQLLDQYGLIAHSSGSFADRQGLVARIGALFNALHGVKEQLVYPLLTQRLSLELLQSAQEDHRLLCRQLKMVAASEAKDSIDIDMQTFAEHLRAYFAMEEERLFPHVAQFDSVELGQQVALRRSAALGDQGAD